jgi:peptidoglycan/xylan/chitin deacetylase (PgdA/CDA1 family)
MSSATPRIPVVMLHSVAGYRPDRPETFPVWCPPEMFEGYLRYLSRRGYHTIDLHQWHAHMSEGAPLPDKPIALTFDDGYLDNWVYAAPLLRKYGFKATVFVATDFVQPGQTCRQSLEDVWAGRAEEASLEVFGYMNRAELRAAAEEGVLDVQSHGRTHTWWPVSDTIVDFHRPDVGMRHARWMWWNAFPDRKPFWFHQFDRADLPWGLPVYESALALARPAVARDRELDERLVRRVAEEGGASFFERPDWREQLEGEVRAHREEGRGAVKPETPEAFEERLRDELAGSRERLEALTGRPVRFMCWPNGGVCDEAYGLLEACGYAAATYPSRARERVNRRGHRPDRIARISATSYFRGSRRVLPWVASFALKVERNRGNWLATIPIRLIWLWRKLVPASRHRPHGADV